MAKKICVKDKLQPSGMAELFRDTSASDRTDNTSSDVTCDNGSDNKCDINITLKKKKKYTDTHIRKTYYFRKDNFKMLEKLKREYQLDYSYIINEALDLYFKTIGARE